jgi:hypothetical protein
MFVHLALLLLQAVNVRPLSSVNALVRFAEEPQMLAVEFNDGCPTHVRKFCQPSFGSYQELVDASYLPGLMQALSFLLRFPSS